MSILRLLLSQFVLFLCSDVRAERTPNILWIMLDDLRPDALGCYGQPWVRTPTFDRIAASGVVFKNAYAQSVVCRPSRLSMLTSHYCHSLGDMAMGEPAEDSPGYLPDKPPLQQLDLPRALSKLGLNAVNVGKTHWEERWNMVPVEHPPRADLLEFDPPSLQVYRPIRIVSPQIYPPNVGRGTNMWTIGGGNPLVFEELGPHIKTEAALDAIEKTNPGEPFFLRVSFWAPHIPIMTPLDFMVPPESVRLPVPTADEIARKPYFERLQLAQYASVRHLSPEALQIARGSYYGLVSFVDLQVARLLERLDQRGQLQNTLIIINSDHGLQLGEHGLHKKRNFYEQTVSTPLIFNWPGHLPEGVVVDELVELVDLLPTLLDLLGLEVPDGIAGRSLMPLIRGEVESWRDAVFSEIDHSMSRYTALRVYSGRRVMVRTKEWKMIYFRDDRTPSEDGALYDLVHDPEEKSNLYDDEDYAAVVALLKERVDEWDAGERFEPR